MTSSKERLTPQDKYTSAFEMLDVRSEDGLSVLKTAYKDLIKKHHPDKGGDNVEAQRINEAYGIGLEYYNSQASNKDENLPASLPTFQEKINARLEKMTQESFDIKTRTNHTVREDIVDVAIFKPRTFATVREEFQDLAALDLKKQSLFVSSSTMPEEIFVKVFGPQSPDGQKTKKCFLRFYDKEGSSEQEKNRALWYARYILDNDQVAPLVLLELADVLVKVETPEQMIENGAFCQAFMRWYLDLFPISVGEDRQTVKHYGQIFQKLFLFFLTDQERKQNLAPLVSAVKTARHFTSWNNNKQQAQFEMAEIFTLILQEKEFTVEEMTKLFKQAHDIMGGDNLGGGRVRLIQQDWGSKLQPFLDYLKRLKRENYSFPQIESLLEIIVLIQSTSRTDIPYGQYISVFVSFAQRLEEVINKDWLNPQESGQKKAPAVDFVKTMVRSVRGYLSSNPKEYMDEWVEAFSRGFQMFTQQPTMFRLLMRALRQLSIEIDASGKEQSLSRYYGIKVPVATCVYAAEKLPAYLNEFFQDNPALQEVKIMELQESLKGYNESSYFTLKKRRHDDDHNLTTPQKEDYRFLASIQRRKKQKGFLLPDDIDQLARIFLARKPS